MPLFLQVSSDATAAELRALLRGDAAALIFGVLLLSAGVVALILFVARREAKDLALLAFGGFSGLYGLRLLASQVTTGLVTGLSGEILRTICAYITYVLPVPAFSLWERMLGRGWKSTLRLGVKATLVFAVFAVTLEGLLGAHELLMVVNNVLVISGMVIAMINLFFFPPVGVPGLGALRLGSVVLGVFVLGENLAGLGFPVWRRGQEVIGFFFFSCCLGYAAAVRVTANEKKLLAIGAELETARRIQSSILPEGVPDLPGLEVAVRYVPAASVAGDFYDFLAAEGKCVGILVADVSGHGVPAALIASMIKVALQSVVPSAHNPAEVLSGLNRILSGPLRGQFVSAAYLWIDLEIHKGLYSAAGHPPLLCWRKGELERIESNGLLFGVVPDAEYPVYELLLNPGNRLLLYTDGLIEPENALGEFFGDCKLEQVVRNNQSRPPADLSDQMLFEIRNWRPVGKNQQDDITLIVVDIV